nr:MAG TPA: hypothetical protein [Caudoviricetes sp.]
MTCEFLFHIIINLYKIIELLTIIQIRYTQYFLFFNEL